MSLRATIVFDKATGRLSGIEWSDLPWLFGAGQGDRLEQLAETLNPFEVIASPRRSTSDIAAGGHLFTEHCSSCHGDGGRGGPGGPALPDRVFRQGRTDWALYRTITRGIPGTAMVGRQLPRDDVWRLVSYVGKKILAPDTETAYGASAPAPERVAPVTAAELRNAADDPAEWLTYSGSYSGQRHSTLSQINRETVHQLRLEWQRQFYTNEAWVETTPIVRGPTMFVTEPPNRVNALDAATGHILWTHSRPLLPDRKLCCGTVNRGVAVLGNLVFVATLDAHLLALDANTGKLAWDVAVGQSANGYSITGAPLAIDDMVITGVAGGEFAIRGFIDAYDAATGKRRWRFYTVPAAGERGSETWNGNSLEHGGAPTWLTGAFDPALRLIYWGVGNPSPVFYGGDRSGDNLYSNSVVALDADTGKLRWYFQFTPHDLHDWDSVQIPVLIDAEMDNVKRRLLVWPNRNAFYYVFDRVTGQFLLGTPFVKQTWADGLDANGRPRVRPESIPTREGAVVYPGYPGGINWWSPSYDPDSQLLYVPTITRGSIYFASPDRPPDELGEVQGSVSIDLPNEGLMTAVKALEPTTGRVRWQHTFPPRDFHPGMGGLVSTAGHIIFGSDLERFFALDAETGNELWHFESGGKITAAPMTYALNGRQYVAIASGRSILSFALPQEETQTNPPTSGH